MPKTKTSRVEYRSGIRERYPDVLTGPVVDALEALAPFNRDRLAIMAARQTARARDRRHIEFLDPDATISSSALSAAARAIPNSPVPSSGTPRATGIEPRNLSTTAGTTLCGERRAPPTARPVPRARAASYAPPGGRDGVADVVLIEDVGRVGRVVAELVAELLHGGTQAIDVVRAPTPHTCRRSASVVTTHPPWTDRMRSVVLRFTVFSTEGHFATTDLAVGR